MRPMVNTSSPPLVSAGVAQAVSDSAIAAADAAATKRNLFIAILFLVLGGRRACWGAGGTESFVAPDDQRNEPHPVRCRWNFFTDHAAPAHDDRAVGDLHHVIHGVRNDEYRTPLFTESEDEVEHLTRLSQSQRG